VHCIPLRLRRHNICDVGTHLPGRKVVYAAGAIRDVRHDERFGPGEFLDDVAESGGKHCKTCRQVSGLLQKAQQFLIHNLSFLDLCFKKDFNEFMAQL
jgi:hypothetical protein